MWPWINEHLVNYLFCGFRRNECKHFIVFPIVVTLPRNWSFSIASSKSFVVVMASSSSNHQLAYTCLCLWISLWFCWTFQPTIIVHAFCFYIQTPLCLCWIACAHEPTPTYEPMWELWEAKWSRYYITSLQQSSKVMMKLGNWYFNIYFVN